MAARQQAQQLAQLLDGIIKQKARRVHALETTPVPIKWSKQLWLFISTVVFALSIMFVYFDRIVMLACMVGQMTVVLGLLVDRLESERKVSVKALKDDLLTMHKQLTLLYQVETLLNRRPHVGEADINKVIRAIVEENLFIAETQLVELAQ